MASPIEILIAALAFGIVGVYLLCWQRFLSKCEEVTAPPPKTVRAEPDEHPPKAHPAHA